MTRMCLVMTMVLVFMAVLVCAVKADEFPAGYENADGYSYVGNGVWSHEGAQYTRSLYQDVGYWYGGCYRQGRYYYRYKAYSAPQKAAYKEPELPRYTDPGWRGKLLDIAAARDRYDGEIRKAQFDHQQYLEAINSLGLTGNFRWNSYGQTPPYSYGQPAQYGGQRMPYEFSGSVNYGVQANSQYGYSYQALKDIYGDNNMTALYQQASQLAQGAQRLSGDATQGFSTLVGQEGGNRARVAEIIARGQMAGHILQALQGPGETKTYQFKFSPRGDVERIPVPNVDPEDKKQLLSQLSALAAERCASCHSGKTIKGGFDISTYPTLSEEAKKAVWQTLTTDDDKKRMPRSADGGPGKRLTTEELKLFLSN